MPAFFLVPPLFYYQLFLSNSLKKKDLVVKRAGKQEKRLDNKKELVIKRAAK